MQYDYTEKDWKLFRKKIIKWQEAYIDKLNKEYIELLNSEDDPATKFWHLEKRIYKDKRKPGVIIEMSRSKLIYNIVNLLDDEVIHFEDLEDFSDDLKETVQCYFNGV